MKNIVIISTIILLSIFKAFAQIVPAKDAPKHIGKKVTICDMVYGTSSSAEATQLFLGGDYPHQLLTITIKAGDRAKFKGNPEIDFKGKDLCVTGVITNDKGKPQIVVRALKQIQIIMIDAPIKQIPRVN
ncbi:MAG: hypothetical protein ACXVB0_03575 [Mucilaginibacter sp.]